MNILDAMKSARPFRLKNAESKDWIQPDEIKGGKLNIFIKDLLSDDWEIFEERMLITLAQCQKIFSMGMKHASYSDLDNESYRGYKAFLEELGFKNGH